MSAIYAYIDWFIYLNLVFRNWILFVLCLIINMNTNNRYEWE
jgi:hypothetical protein